MEAATGSVDPPDLGVRQTVDRNDCLERATGALPRIDLARAVVKQPVRLHAEKVDRPAPHHAGGVRRRSIFAQPADSLLAKAVRPRSHHILPGVLDLREMQHPRAQRTEQHRLDSQDRTGQCLPEYLVQLCSLVIRRGKPCHPSSFFVLATRQVCRRIGDLHSTLGGEAREIHL